MAGYLGSRPVVVQVDGYQREESEARYVNVSGDDFSGHLDFVDDAKARFGSSDELHIYTESSGSGHSYIQGDNIVIRSAAGTARLTVTSNDVDVSSGALKIGGTTVISNSRAGTLSSLAATGQITSARGSDTGTYGFRHEGAGKYLRMGVPNASFAYFETDANGGFSFEGNVTVPNQILHAGDTDTYMQFHAVNEWRVVAGGYERFAIGTDVVVNEDSHDADFRVESNTNTHMLFVDGGNNRVGIGTSSPSQKVEISNNANSSTWLKILNTDTGSGAASGVLFENNSGEGGAISLRSSAAGGDLLLRTLSTNPLTFATNNTERMRIDSSGKMLIGATSSVGGRLVVDGNSANNIWLIGRDSDGTSSVSFRNNADDAYNARIEAQSSNLMFETNSSERMRIDSSGRVGIGTTSPSSPKFSSSASGVLELRGSKPSFNVQESDVTDAHFNMSMSAGNAYLAATGTGNLILATGTVNWSERMRIDSSGRVTMPYQPNFLVRLPGSSSSLTAGAWTIFPFNTTEWDRGTNFTNSTHRFTAPVAGIYFFHWLVQIEGITTAPTWYYAYPLVNGIESIGGTKGTTAADQVEPTGTYHGIKGTQSLQLAANDYVELKYYWSGGNGTLKGGSESMFAGHLIG